METLESAQTRLEQIRASRVVGICFLDDEGRLIQVFDEDPALKEAIVEHHEDRIRQLRLSTTPKPYPVRED